MSCMIQPTLNRHPVFRALAGLLLLAALVAGSTQAFSDIAGSQARKAIAGSGRVAIVYPAIGEPYRSVFEQIISGIESQTGGHTTNFEVGANADFGELKNSLRQQGVEVVIALGSQGVKFAATLDRDIGVVAGGVIAPAGDELHDAPVQSLSPAPALLFGRLKQLMPGARRVFAVYEPRQNGWLIRYAKEAARAQGLELVAYEGQDMRSAAAAYQNILSVADSRRDAIWLLQDSIGAEGGTILPMVLQEAWNHNLVVFSSNFGHVRRGALFSLYPDNVGMGRRLAGMALGFLSSGSYEEQGMIPLREVQAAINLRTAEHLGVRPGKGMEFGMVFPER